MRGGPSLRRGRPASRPRLPGIAALSLAGLLLGAAPPAAPGPPLPSPPAAAPTAEEAPVTVEAEVETTRLTLGDPLTLTVRVVHDPAVEVVLPDPALELPDGIEQVGHAHTTTREAGRTVERLTWDLRCWRLGRFTLPPVAVTYLGPDHHEQRAANRPIDIEVVSVLQGETQTPRPMTGPVVLPIDYRLWAMVASLGFLLAAGLVAGILAWRRRPRREPPPPPPPPADRVALEALARLADSEALAAGDAERVATDLSAITRHYLEQRLSFPALESTTREVEQWLSGCSEVNSPLQATLLDLLFATDRVKFARGWATVEELTAQIERARAAVVELGSGREEAAATASGREA